MKTTTATTTTTTAATTLTTTNQKNRQGRLWGFPATAHGHNKRVRGVQRRCLRGGLKPSNEEDTLGLSRAKKHVGNPLYITYSHI